MDAIGAWHALLRPDVELSRAACTAFAASMRARKLTFGDRIHCPFLRPFFLTEQDEARMRAAAETIAALGERVVRAALESAEVFDQLGLTDAETRLVRIDPGYKTSSTASRLDAFLLPDSLHFAEYNAESPAGLGYTQRLCELFDALPVMARFREGRGVRFNPTIAPLLEALLASYREWGGTAAPPTMAIVDWRNVPTWTEFEILRDAFVEAGIPTVVCAPEDLSFDGATLTAEGRRIDLVYRRVLINDIVARPGECAALVKAYEARAVCVANTFQCKLAHKKAFFAVLTDDRNAALFSEPRDNRIVMDNGLLSAQDSASWSPSMFAAIKRPRPNPARVPTMPIEAPVIRKTRITAPRVAPMVRRTAMSFDLSFTNMMRPEMMFSAATSTIKVRMMNITLRSTSSAAKNVPLR